MIERNFLREKIESRVPVIGTWNTLASPLVTEVLAHSGFDFVILDCEHGPLHLGAIHDYVARCEKHECSPIVRLPASADWMVLQALDQGAHGVILPNVASRTEVEALIAGVKFNPRGTRGFTPFTKAGGFTNRRAKAYVERANALTLSAILVESLEGLKRLDDILKVGDLDIVYFGAYDLSQELGMPGQVRDPAVVSIMREGVRKVVDAGKCAGGFVAESRQDIEWLLDMGMGFITYDVDTAILARVVEDLVGWFAEKTAR